MSSLTRQAAEHLADHQGHLRDRFPDEPARAERRDRGGEGRRSGPRVRGRRRRGPLTGLARQGRGREDRGAHQPVRRALGRGRDLVQTRCRHVADEVVGAVLSAPSRSNPSRRRPRDRARSPEPSASAPGRRTPCPLQTLLMAAALLHGPGCTCRPSALRFKCARHGARASQSRRERPALAKGEKQCSQT